jgi:hypothetical protein
MDLSYAQERLTKEFTGIFSAAVVIECLEGEVTTLSRGARITSYIPMLAERLAREHLKARRPQKAA